MSRKVYTPRPAVGRWKGWRVVSDASNFPGFVIPFSPILHVTGRYRGNGGPQTGTVSTFLAAKRCIVAASFLSLRETQPAELIFLSSPESLSSLPGWALFTQESRKRSVEAPAVQLRGEVVP